MKRNGVGTDQVRAFDKVLKEQYSYEFVISKFVWIMLMALGMLFMLFPAQDIAEMNNVPLMLLGMGIMMYLRPYMMVAEGKQMVSIYRKLKCAPVARKEIQAVRCSYLNSFCLKFFLAGFAAQQAAALISGCWGILNLIYPVGLWFLLWLAGVGFIYGIR